MELKRILARDSRSANEKAMQMFGPDVLVISTQRVGDQIELIVAIDEQPEPVAKAAPEPSTSQSVQASQAEKDEVFAEIFGTVQRLAASSAPVESPPLAAVEPVQAKVSAPARKSRVVKSNAGTAAKPTLAKKTPEITDLLQQELARSREIVELLRQEVGVLRREFSLNRQLQPWTSGIELNQDVRTLIDELTNWGVPAGLLALLTSQASGCGSAAEALDVMRLTLQGHLDKCPSVDLSPGMHALVGPSGAGKTSMTVRLAHMHGQITGVEKQAVISFGDSRPGAWAQIQMLAASAGVDVFRATDLSTLQLLVEDLGGKSHIWIDTGANAHFSSAQALKDCDLPIRLHAVLPTDASVASMHRCKESGIEWHSLMLTKADEGNSVWQWLQFLSESPMAISCVAHSEQVQQAAQRFDPQTLVAQAFAGLKSVPQGVKSTTRSTPVRRRAPAKSKAVHV